MFKNGIRQIEHTATDCVASDVIDTATGQACTCCGARVDVISVDYVRGFYMAEVDKAFSIDRSSSPFVINNAEYMKGYREAMNG